MKKIFIAILIGLTFFTLASAAKSVGAGVLQDSDGTYYCSDPMKEYSAGTCDCKYPYVQQSDGSCGAASSGSSILQQQTEVNNANEYLRTKCEGTGGSWSGTSCSCPHDCNLVSGYCVGPGSECAAQSDVNTWTGSGSSGSGSSNGSTGSSGSGSGYQVASGGPVSVSVELPTTGSSGTIGNPISSNTFAELIMMIVGWIKNIALALAPLVVVWGGVLCITSSGDAKKFQTGKDMILYAAIGLLVVLLAEGLVGILKDLVVK